MFSWGDHKLIHTLIHTLLSLLPAQGQVFWWGDNKLIHTLIHTLLSFLPSQGQVFSWGDNKLIHTLIHTLLSFLSAQGQVFSWGDNEQVHTLIHIPPPLRGQVSSWGNNELIHTLIHTLLSFLPAQGQVFSWGDNEFGQLGWGTEGGEPSNPQPRHIRAVRGRVVRCECDGETKYLAFLTSSHKGYLRFEATVQGRRRPLPATQHASPMKYVAADTCGTAPPVLAGKTYSAHGPCPPLHQCLGKLAVGSNHQVLLLSGPTDANC